MQAKRARLTVERARPFEIVVRGERTRKVLDELTLVLRDSVDDMLEREIERHVAMAKLANDRHGATGNCFACPVAGAANGTAISGENEAD